LQRRLAVTGLAEDSKFGALFQTLPQTAAEHRVIVGDDYADFIRHFLIV
jgi:hypothetical protein